MAWVSWPEYKYKLIIVLIDEELIINIFKLTIELTFKVCSKIYEVSFFKQLNLFCEVKIKFPSPGWTSNVVFLSVRSWISTSDGKLLNAWEQSPKSMMILLRPWNACTSWMLLSILMKIIKLVIWLYWIQHLSKVITVPRHEVHAVVWNNLTSKGTLTLPDLLTKVLPAGHEKESHILIRTMKLTGLICIWDDEIYLVPAMVGSKIKRKDIAKWITKLLLPSLCQF